jgi:hypothetical protein
MRRLPPASRAFHSTPNPPASRLSDPANSGRQRHGHLGARRGDLEHDVGLVQHALVGADEGAAAADVAQHADVVLQGARDLPGDRKLDGQALMAARHHLDGVAFGHRNDLRTFWRRKIHTLVESSAAVERIRATAEVR